MDGTLLTLLRVYDFQHDLISKLAAECACGVPGSAIFLSHNWREMDTINKSLNELGYSTVPPLVYYVKVLFYIVHIKWAIYFIICRSCNNLCIFWYCRCFR